HASLREAGGLLLVTTEALRSGGEMVGERHRLFELDHDEGLDIDPYDDLVVARGITEQGRIVLPIPPTWGGAWGVPPGEALRGDPDTMKNGSSRNLLVNDMLDTTEEDVLIARTLGYKVVNVDDLGPGAPFA